MAFEIEVPEDVSMPARGAMAISPDGTHIAFLGRKAGVKQLYLRSLKRLEVTAVPGTEGAQMAFFSPDSQWLGYATPTRLWKVALGGGQPIPICDVTGVDSAFWAQDDTIIFASNQYLALARVKASGGAPQLVSHREGPRELFHLDPEVLPGGKAVIFGTHDGSGSGGFQNIVMQLLVTGERKTLLEGARFPRYAASGHLVYESGQTMMAAPFDKDILTLTGPAVRIEGVSLARFSRQGTGTLAWVPSVPQPEKMLVWVDREGNETRVIDARKQYYGPRVSPDGNRLAFWVGGTDSHVWILDLRRGVMDQLTTTGRGNWWCSWSPDGSRIAFISLRSEKSPEAANLYWKAADGSGAAEQLTQGPFYDQPTSWTRDGKSIIVQRSFHPQTGWDVMLLSLGGDRKLQPLLNSPANESRGEQSPDGRWLAYVSTEAGPPSIFVRAFQGPQRKWRISPAGISAGDPLWSPDGRELFYRDLDAEKVVAVDVETGDEFAAGTPRVLFDDCYFEHIAYGRTYDITPDGRRFVMVKEMNPPHQRIAVVLNWFEELKRLVPPGEK
jgi:serine/threonine-protein kinase